MFLLQKLGWGCVVFAMPFLVSASDIHPVQPAVNGSSHSDTETSIAMPGGSMYMSRGIYASLAGGQNNNSGESQSLFQWQGEVSYYYTHWFSGGAGFKMLAGQPSDSSQVIQNRFFVLNRFHKSWSRASAYLGVQIGMDDLNVSLSPLDTGNFRQPLRELNAGMGIELGGGWKFSRFVGATFAERFEASFVGEATDNPEAGSASFRTLPGIALDILALAPPLKKNVKAFYAFTEFQFGELLLENQSRKRDFSWITGFSVAF